MADKIVKLNIEVPMVEAITINKEMIDAGKGALGRMICEECPYDILAEMVYAAMRPLETSERTLVKP